jgi:hypothetical protein
MAGFIRRATGTITTVDADEVRRALALFADPGGGQELFSLPAGRSRTLPGSDLSGLVRAAADLAEGSTGVYWRMNPVPPDLSRAARVGDIAHRRWLLIDVDPCKPDGLADESATPEEKIHAITLGRDVVAWLAEEHGWPEPVFVDSGNGAQALYRVNLPADKVSQALLRKLLNALAAKFDTDHAVIDRACHNATRLAKLPGTMARKGTPTADRPHRPAVILNAPPEVQVVTLEQLEDVAGVNAPSPPPTPPQPAHEVNGYTRKATSGEPGQAWARKALEDETARVRSAPVKERNNTLNVAAFNLGQIVAGGGLGRGEVEAELLAAGLAAGLTEEECPRTIASGLDAGAASPRTPPEKEQVAAKAKDKEREQERKRRPGYAKIWTLTELLTTDFPPPQWVIPGILSEGLTILAGKPKLGKSWLALNIALTVAAGGLAFGKFKVLPGDVLYLSLEDRLRRIQDRSRKVLSGLKVEASSRLHVAVEWDRQGDGGVEAIEKWAKSVERPALVIIDVYTKFRPIGKGNRNAYQQDYDDLGILKDATDALGMNGLLVHHCKKGKAEDALEEVSGSMGMGGATDGTMILTRARSEMDAELFITGRDVEEGSLALEFDPKGFTWTCHGSAAERSDSKYKLAAIELFKLNPGAPLGIGEMADRLNVPMEKRHYFRTILARMDEAGLIERVGVGRYRWPVKVSPWQADVDSGSPNFTESGL